MHPTAMKTAQKVSTAQKREVIEWYGATPAAAAPSRDATSPWSSANEPGELSPPSARKMTKAHVAASVLLSTLAICAGAIVSGVQRNGSGAADFDTLPVGFADTVAPPTIAESTAPPPATTTVVAPVLQRRSDDDASTTTAWSECSADVLTLHSVDGLYATTYLQTYFEHLWAKVNDSSLNLTFASYPSTDAYEAAAANGSFCAGDMVLLESWGSCEYTWTETNPLMLWSFSYFRTILNYSKPLQILWTDASCRIEFDATTHHKIYRAGTSNNLSAAVGNLPMPWGLETACNDKATMRVANKSLAFNVRAASMFRRPGRVDAAKALAHAKSDGRLTSAINSSFLARSGRAWNGTGYLVDMPKMHGTNFSYSYDTMEAWPDYCDLLESSIFTLVPGGDDYWDTRYAEAILAGSIPVVYAGDRYKQCHKPAENNFKVVGAPFMYVEDWDDFPSLLANALDLGVDGLQAWQDRLLAWYDDYSAQIHTAVTSSKASMLREVETDTYERSTCVEVDYSYDETKEALLRKAAYDVRLREQRAREAAAASALRAGGLTLANLGGLGYGEPAVGNNTYVATDGNLTACGGGKWETCDNAYMPSCTCRYGDNDTYYGDDTWCDFGTCFSPECVVHGVKNFSCAVVSR